MKKKLVLLFIICLVGMVLSTGCISQKTTPSNTTTLTSNETPIGGNITVLTVNEGKNIDGLYSLIGTVRNDNSFSANIVLKAQFMDANGSVLGDRLDYVENIYPGQTATYELDYSGDPNKVVYWAVSLDSVSKV